MSDHSLVFVSIHCERGPDAVPLGAASVASFVQSEFPRIQLLEAHIDESPSRIFNRLSQLCSSSVSSKKRAIGFSLYSWNRGLSKTVAELYKKEYPGDLLFAGGPEVTARPDGLSISEGGPFSVLIQGEGESALKDSCRLGLWYGS